MMGDPLGSSRVSSQKQNREGVVGAQIRQYRATVVERARKWSTPGRDVTKQASVHIPSFIHYRHAT